MSSGHAPSPLDPTHAPQSGPKHPFRNRAVLIGLGALLLLLAITPFLPKGGNDEGSLEQAGNRPRPANATGYGAISTQMQAEIDRVVGEGEAQGEINARTAAKMLPADLVARTTRCADFEGLRYCLGTGWTSQTQAQVQARTTIAAREIAARGKGQPETTGDLDPLAEAARVAAAPAEQRAAQDRAELTQAARSVAKVWLLRHEILGERLPKGFLDRHPEARETAGARLAAGTTSPSVSPSATTTAAVTATATPTTITKTKPDYPLRDKVLKNDQVAEQETTYWCGPTSMQMIAWGWKQVDKGQAHWADRIGTTRSGSSITDIVSVINRHTGWDKPEYAGPYVTLDISDFTYDEWMLLIMRHITDYRAPVLLHPVLRKEYYPYLDDDASGHFQVGRGYRQREGKTEKLGYFEPWNQQRFDPSEPFIERVQWRNAYKSYRANLAHFQHNIGV